MKTRGRSLRLTEKVSVKDHMRGSPPAPVNLVGYGDFSNPECTRTYRTVKEIQRKMGTRVLYAFRSFPEPARFGNSEDAAEAAECASSQGKFWEMHDLLFENEGASDEIHLYRYARELGMNLGRFRGELKSHVHAAKINTVRDAGVRSGVMHAPTFFINSIRHESSFGLATLLPAVQAAAGGSKAVPRVARMRK